jgi:hypothetical protein
MAAVSITAANVIASAAATIRKEYSFAATVTAGQLVYLNASNQWALCDTDGGLGTGINDLRGIALNGGAINQPASVCTDDPDFTFGGTVSNGLAIYGFTTAGAISFADIPTTAAYPILVGIAKSATKGILRPMASGVII